MWRGLRPANAYSLRSAATLRVACALNLRASRTVRPLGPAYAYIGRVLIRSRWRSGVFRFPLVALQTIKGPPEFREQAYLLTALHCALSGFVRVRKRTVDKDRVTTGPAIRRATTVADAYYCNACQPTLARILGGCPRVDVRPIFARVLRWPVCPPCGGLYRRCWVSSVAGSEDVVTHIRGSRGF